MKASQMIASIKKQEKELLCDLRQTRDNKLRPLENDLKKVESFISKAQSLLVSYVKHIRLVNGSGFIVITASLTLLHQ